MDIEPDEVSAKFDQEFDKLSDYSNTVWAQAMGKKLGIFSATQEDLGLINNWLHYLENEKLDFTNSFHDLTTFLTQDESQTIFNAPFKASSEFEHFLSSWKKRLKQQTQDIEASKKLMQQSNPVFIPRNHQIEKAITQAITGNYEHFHLLNRVLAKPFSEQEEYQALTEAPSDDEIIHQTFCGT
jgi:uncharacterized protein YdiU (UPF0061 family)